MPFMFDTSARYDMPVVFGPSRLPDVTVMEELRNVAIPFLSTAEAIAALLPPFFELTGEPVVTVSSSENRGVDWLAGRHYNVARVQVNVAFRGSETVTGPYSLVIWESDAKPVIAGRELQGYAKLAGEIPDHVRTDTIASFQCGEYGTCFLRGDVSGLEPLPQSTIDKMNAVEERVALGWKYIPSPEGGADVDYPTKLLSGGAVNAAWRGEGRIEWIEPSWEQCPGSAHIVAALKQLPILEYRPAIITHSRVTLPRNAVTRLYPAGEAP